MAQLQKLIKNMQWELAEKKHACANNKLHVIHQHERRLSIEQGTRAGYKRYCSDCGKKAIEKALSELSNLLTVDKQV